MVVAEFNLVCVALLEPEADPPLVIDGDGVLTGTIPLEGVQTIAGRDTKVLQLGSGVERLQLSQRPAGDVRRHPSIPAGAEERLGRAVGERLDHAGLYRVT